MKNIYKWFLNVIETIISQIQKYINVDCEIETPQFLGCQEKYYLFRQTGKYNIITRRFKTDNSVPGSHDVKGFKSYKDFKKYVVRLL